MKTEIQASTFEKYLEENRHGLICVIILIIGCLGGLAVGFKAIENTFALSLVVIPTMTTLSLLLSVSPMKSIVTLAAISVSIDVLVLLYYLIIG